VVVVAAVVGVGIALSHHPARKKPVPARAEAARAVPMPAQMPSITLFQALTQDIQAKNEAAFLSQVAPSARQAVQTWWENLQAIGFSTGVIMPVTSSDLVPVDSHGNGTITVLAGVHSPLDPVDGTGLPDIPSEQYQVGLHFASASAAGQITSWRPLGDAPWDQGSQLDVRKAADVVVAGPASDSGIVASTLPIAEAAASYDIGLLDHLSRGDLHQQGFVVFVSGTPAVENSWFSNASLPQGWPSESGGGRTVPIPGASRDSADILSGVSTGITGGARVVITPSGNGKAAMRAETLQLVGQFMMDVLASDDEASVPSVPSWAIQGFGLAVQALYAQNTNPAPRSYNFAPLTNLLHGLPSSYRTGRLPTSQQLFTGRAASEQDFNDVAASVYAYIGIKYGVNQMLNAASLLYPRDDTPFGNVQAPATKRRHGYYPAGTIESGWHAFLVHS
jgi:hypothetical protein